MANTSVLYAREKTSALIAMVPENVQNVMVKGYIKLTQKADALHSASAFLRPKTCGITKYSTYSSFFLHLNQYCSVELSIATGLAIACFLATIAMVHAD